MLLFAGGVGILWLRMSGESMVRVLRRVEKIDFVRRRAAPRKSERSFEWRSDFMGREMKGRAPLPDMLRPRVSCGLRFRPVIITQARTASAPTRMPGKNPAKKTPGGKLVDLEGGGLLELRALVGVTVTVVLVVEVTCVVVGVPVWLLLVVVAPLNLALVLSRTQTSCPPLLPQV